MKFGARLVTALTGAVIFWILEIPQAKAASAIGDVRAYQVLTKQGNFYPAAAEVHVSFTLTRAADVTVEVGAHRADGEGWLLGPPYGRYLAEPTHVQTLKLGHLEAGGHEAVWDGLDDKGQPLSGTNLLGHWQLIGVANGRKGLLVKPEEMVTHSPVNLFRFTVKAGSEQSAVNYRRTPEGVGAYREIILGDITALSQDEKGGFIAGDPTAVEAYHLSPSFQLTGYIPALCDLFDQNDCREAPWAFADGHGHALVANGHSMYRFSLDGQRVPWTKSAYTNGEVLGRGPTPQDTEVTIKSSPGATFGIYNWAVDASGNISVLRAVADLGKHPDWNQTGIESADVQVFDNNGVFQRTVTLPEETHLVGPKNYTVPRQLAADNAGNFWVGGVSAMLVDGKTGAYKGRFTKPTTNVAVGKDGSVYAWDADTGNIYRLHADATPFPFGTAAPGNKNNGESLSWRGPESPLPASLQKAQPTAIVGCQKGDFYVLMQPGANSSDQAVLHFSADGTFLPETLPRVDLEPSSPANIFVENEPATFNFFVSNPTAQDRRLTMDWTLTDFFGKQTSGKTEFEAKAMSHQSCAVNLPVPEFGFYRLTGTLEGEGLIFNTTLARLRAHDAKPAPDSHFGVVWNLDFYYGALLGQKKERAGTDMWQWREPVQDMVVPDIPDNPQSGFTAHRAQAERWGVLCAEMSNYAEPWTEGYFENQIHDITLYLKDWMEIVDKVEGHSVQHYQFWNEPNNYWHQNGAFQWDFYDTVNGDFWDVNKARDKEVRSIADGNSGNYDILTKMADDGTSIYNDAVECHYQTPGGSQPKPPANLGVSEMGSYGFPENSRFEMQKLVVLRDKLYPGKPILDTEEGWYTDNTISEKAGADSIPRLEIPDIAVGADEIYYFCMGSAGGLPDSTTYPLNVRHPSEMTVRSAFCSFATMTQMLEGAEYVGPVDLQTPATLAYLFRKGDTMILPVWAMVGQAYVTIPIGEKSVTVFDLMSRKSQIKGAADGSIPLHLTDSTLYVTFPFNAWAKSIAKAELDRQLSDLKLDNVAAITQEMGTVAPTSLTDLGAMNRFYHLVKAARQAAFAGEWAGSASGPDAVKGLRTAVTGKEGPDGFLRQTRLPLNWTEQIVRVAAIQGGELEKRLWSVANESAKAAQSLLAAEAVNYPGVALNALIGDAGEVEKTRGVPSTGPNYPFYDSSFRTQLPKKAGDTFELELTAWNFYRHAVQGKMAPKLPDGWTSVAAKPQDSFSLDPGKFARATYTVTVPAGTKPGVYPVDGETTFNGKTQPGILPQRVQVQ